MGSTMKLQIEALLLMTLLLTALICSSPELQICLCMVLVFVVSNEKQVREFLRPSLRSHRIAARHRMLATVRLVNFGGPGSKPDGAAAVGAAVHWRV